VAYNLLITKQGGWLHLDEPLEDQPSEATVTVSVVDSKFSSFGAFPSIVNQPCTLDDLVLTLPDRAAPWRTVVPSSTAGDVGDLTETRRRFVLNRGGRRSFLRVSEYDLNIDGDVTSIRFDEGIDFSVKAGDTLKGVRCSYYVDLDGIEFVGRIKADWRVVVNGRAMYFSYIYDCMRQALGQPATWADVLSIRPDADNELSQVPNKERFVTQAWEEVARDLYNMGIRHNLIIPNGSTILRDATVLQTVYNLVMYQNLSIPQSFIGQGEDYTMHLERKISKTLGQFLVPVDENQDGKITPTDEQKSRRQVWFRGRRTLRRQ
jgi:hypothetical protein